MIRPFDHIIRSVKSAARSNGAGAFVDQGIISGLNFVTFLMLARWLPTDMFGAYVLAFSALMFVQTVQHALLTRAHNVLGARKTGADYESFSRTVLILVLGGAAGLGLAVGGLSGVFRVLGLPAWTAATAGLAVAIGPWLVQDAIRRLLYTAERVPAAAVNDAVSYVLQAGLIGWMMISGVEPGLMMVFAILGGSSLAASLVGWVQLRPRILREPGAATTFFRDTRTIWHYGKWLTSGELVGWIGQNGNTWLIGGLLGAPLVAGYRAATYVTNLLNPFDLAVSNYLPVRASRVLSERGQSAMFRWLASKALLLGVPYALLAVAISFGAAQLLDLFYDARYVSTLLALVLTISVWARFLGFIVNFARIGLMASERTLPIFISQIIGLVLFAVLSTVAISLVGIAGAPLSRIMLQVVVGLYLLRSLTDSPTSRATLPGLGRQPSNARI